MKEILAREKILIQNFEKEICSHSKIGLKIL